MALEEACASGNADAVTCLLRDNPDVNDNSRGASPLAHACKHGHLQVAQMLLQHGATDPNIGVAKNLSSPLLVAASLGHIDIVRALTGRKRVDVNKARRDGVTPLIIAVQQSHTDCIAALCSCPRLKVSARALFPERITALHIAIRTNNLGAVRMLLAHPAMDLKSNEYMRETPLEIASQLGDSHSAIVDLLRSYEDGADLESPDLVGSSTPKENVAPGDENQKAHEDWEGYPSKLRMMPLAPPDVKIIEQKLEEAFLSRSWREQKYFCVQDFHVEGQDTASMSLHGSLNAGLDPSNPIFAAHLCSIFLLAGSSLASSWSKRYSGAEAEYVVKSSSASHSYNFDRAEVPGLLIHFQMVVAADRNPADTAGKMLDTIKARCQATDTGGAHVATFDFVFDAFRE